MVRPTHRTVARRGRGTITDEYHVYVKLVGNDRHEVAVHLEHNGRQLEPGESGYPDSPPVIAKAGITSPLAMVAAVVR